ncbi:MAG TPA: DUF559 domain-containing protein [Candidatus Dormibacteraeota bacterium]
MSRRGLPTLSLLRTLADISQRRSLVEAVVAIDMALHQGLTSTKDISAYIARNAGTKWARRFGRAAGLADMKAESPMESTLRVLLVKSGLPRPEAQVEINDGRGLLVGRVDLYFAAQRLAIEYDGATHKVSLAVDNRRQNALLLEAGVMVLRYTYADVVGSPERVVAEVASAYRARSNAGTSRSKRRRAA